ncbi:MAG TPA: dTMP kinase [Rhodospirillales bacterium]|nr:MAG: Thymidylate kinase [Alphaproteobacteria bacterium MarineAlpha3_Bin2]HIM77609.1 dTMP kinase [Rhodospirillales bacterium]
MSRGPGLKAQGKFISLEGGEGAGKTTQIKMLADTLKAAGFDPVITREPGGAPGAEMIRSLLVEGDIDRWQPMTEALLHFAARLEHVRETIAPALEEGQWVVSDRFSDSTIAYQGYGHDLGQETMARLHELVLGGFQTDLTLILDIPVEAGLARAGKREAGKIEAGESAGEDRYERMDLDFHRRLRDGFLDIARRNSERCLIVDADQAPDQVHTLIREIVQNRFGVDLT